MTKTVQWIVGVLVVVGLFAMAYGWWDASQVSAAASRLTSGSGHPGVVVVGGGSGEGLSALVAGILLVFGMVSLLARIPEGAGAVQSGLSMFIAVPTAIATILTMLMAFSGWLFIPLIIAGGQVLWEGLKWSQKTP